MFKKLHEIPRFDPESAVILTMVVEGLAYVPRVCEMSRDPDWYLLAHRGDADARQDVCDFIAENVRASFDWMTGEPDRACKTLLELLYGYGFN